MALKADIAFCRALPKIELHAHLSGSISRDFLHDIWLAKQDECSDLEDPLDAIRPNGVHHDVLTFFPLFDKYIYNLINDARSVKAATKSVIADFRDDGVVYLELRTTPREAAGMTKTQYITAVHEAIDESNVDSGDVIQVRLLLSIDRRMSAEQAMDVVDLAISFKNGVVAVGHGAECHGLVVGVDLCGNPMKGDITVFEQAFAKARSNSLKITLHFAEVPQSSSDAELEALLSYQPDRLGHVIHVPQKFKDVIAERELGLELCLSCNVLAKLTEGGFAEHHFGDWRKTKCPIALSTDDVGIFDSPLSNEYLLASEHFGLGAEELVALSKCAVRSTFGGDWQRERVLELIAAFEASMLE